MLESDRNCNFKMTLVKWRATVSCMLLFTSLALITTSSQQQLQFSGMSACMLIYYSCTTTSTPTVIVAANSSSTLITTLTLGATDTSSSVELVHNVPPAVYTTNASTLVSAGYFLYLGGTRLEIFNNSADILQPLHSIILSDCENPRRLSLGKGVFGSSLVHIVEAIGLVECKTRVYALFPDFRLQKRLDVSTDTKASIAVLPRSDNTTLALVTRSGAPIVFFSNLDGSFNPSPAFPSSITCLPSAPPLQPYGIDEVILHCPNGPRYFCTPDSCESQPITNLNAGVQKLQVAFNKDIAVAANSDSITVYRNRFTTMCSINATDRQRFYLSVTSEATILVLVNPTNISLYNLTNGCSPPITVLTTDSALRHNIINGYLILTTLTAQDPNMYNVTIVNLITGERMYSVLLTRTPLVYQLRLIHSPPSPSLTTITNSTTSVPPVSSSQVLQTSPVISTSSATSIIKPEHTSQLTLNSLTTLIPISPITSNAVGTSSPSTTAIPTPNTSFPSIALSIGLAAGAGILIILIILIPLFVILACCTRTQMYKRASRYSSRSSNCSQQMNTVSNSEVSSANSAEATETTPSTCIPQDSASVTSSCHNGVQETEFVVSSSLSSKNVPQNV